MYTSSTSSTAYPSRRHGAGSSSTAMASSTSSRRHPDERLSNGPLVDERAMMEKIRAKLEHAQRRMARERATGSSQHGYNSSRAMPMSGMSSMGGVASHHHHEYQSSRSTHHHHHHHHHVSSTTPGSTRYAPPSTAHRSGRAPAVQSVYLEDLPMALHSSQRPPPSSRAPTSYAPGGGTTTSNGASYYAPEMDESVVRPRHKSVRSRHVSSQHFEAASVPSRSHVRSEHHAVHHLEQHHHHHHHRHGSEKEMTASRHDQRVPRPPPSTRGILRKTSSISQQAPPSANMPFYGNENAPPSNYAGYSSSHHSSVPLSSHHHRPPLTSNGKPQRSALKQQRSDVSDVSSRRAREENDTAASDASDLSAVVAPPPSSRVRFQDELRDAIAHSPLCEIEEEVADSDTEQQLEFLGEELPYDPVDDLEYNSNEENNDDDDYYGGDYDTDAYPYAVPVEDAPAGFEPVVEIKQARAVAEDESFRTPTPQETTGSSPVVAPTSPANQKTRTSSRDFEAVPQRRRGSSAARTPPNLSPSASYARKSLTEPPKSAIDASLIDRFDMRERRASKEKRSSNASTGDVNGGVADSDKADDVDIDALAVSAMTDKPQEAQGDEFATTNMGAFSSSPFDIYETGSDSDYGELSDSSQGSLHESHLAFDDDDVPAVPPQSFYPYRHSNASDKLSPSSTDDYSDAHAFPDEDEDAQPAASGQEQSNQAPTAIDKETPVAELENFWHVEGSDTSDEEGDDAVPEPEAQPKIAVTQAPARQPKLRSSTATYFGFQSRNMNAFAADASSASVATSKTPASPESPPSSPETAPTRAASKVAAAVAPPARQQSPHHRQRDGRPVPSRGPVRDHHHDYHDHPHHHHAPSSRKPMPLSQSLMMLAPPSAARSGHRPPPASTHIRPSPATARLSSSMSSTGGVPRAPVTADGSLAGSTYVPRRLRPKAHASQPRKVLPPSIGALSGLASGPVTFELNVSSFYEVEWTTGEFGFSFQRVYLEENDDDDDEPSSRRMFLRMLLNTERGTCPSFKQVHSGDVLVEIDGTRVCDIKLDKNGGGAALTKLFTELRTKTPLRLVFQRMDPMTWEGGVEL